MFGARRHRLIKDLLHSTTSGPQQASQMLFGPQFDTLGLAGLQKALQKAFGENQKCLLNASTFAVQQELEVPSQGLQEVGGGVEV